jgi:hypothetical protein
MAAVFSILEISFLILQKITKKVKKSEKNAFFGVQKKRSKNDPFLKMAFLANLSEKVLCNSPPSNMF